MCLHLHRSLCMDFQTIISTVVILNPFLWDILARYTISIKVAYLYKTCFVLVRGEDRLNTDPMQFGVKFNSLVVMIRLCLHFKIQFKSLTTYKFIQYFYFTFIVYLRKSFIDIWLPVCRKSDIFCISFSIQELFQLSEHNKHSLYNNNGKVILRISQQRRGSSPDSMSLERNSKGVDDAYMTPAITVL